MKVSIRKLEKKLSLILPLAESYQLSYNTLSKDYKTEEEMKLYTPAFFVKKLWKIAEDTSSTSAVLMVEEKPCGFVRYSQVPEYYKNAQNGQAQEAESGTLDGHNFFWCRKVKFDADIEVDDKTLIVNQIYLDPRVQRHGLGTLLLKETMPKLKEQGFEKLIIEYNANNHNAEKFYQTMGFKAFARTKDFDHILEKDGRTQFCISDVKIAHTTIDNAIENIKKRDMLKNTCVVVGKNAHGKSY